MADFEDEVPYNVRLDGDLDGKLHYIFEESKDNDERFKEIYGEEAKRLGTN